MNLLKSILISTTLLLSILTTVVAKETVKLSWQATQVADGLYMLSGVGGFAGGNLGLSVGTDGVVLIDNAMPSTLEIMNEAIKKITDKPVAFLINTHVHFDHAGNNQAFGEQGTHIVAHQNLRTHLLTHGMHSMDTQQDAPKSSLPVITFSQSMNFHLNGKQAHLFHLPNAHTDGDTAIHYTGANVIHMGDVFFNGLFPFIDYTSGGSLNGYIKAQKTVLALADEHTKIIPGHGSLANKQDLQNSIAMLEDTQAIISKSIAEGKTEEEIVALNPLQAKYEKLSWGFITTEKMTRQIYTGVTAVAR